MDKLSMYLGTGNLPTETVHAILDAFYEAGGRNLDTARVYGDNEIQIGQWLQDRGMNDMVILTKGAHPDMNDEDPKKWAPRLTRNDIRGDIEVSLVALRQSCVDAYLLHRDDTSVSVSEVAEILTSLVEKGLTRTVGVSNWSVKRTAALADALEAQGGPRLAYVSNYFGLAHVDGAGMPGGQTTTPELIALAEEREFQILAYMPRAHGYFGRDPRPGLDPWCTPESERRRAILTDVAAAYNVPMGALETRWLSTVHPAIVPVFGTTRPEGAAQLAQDSTDTSLDPAVVALTAALGDSWRDSGVFRSAE
ncbi:MAG: aldo/keto reductase [Propionibacteriaceae bacterium]|jgi:aryl-alcohol dehydrogenase-like predicted oxidoreductase|nr:aldo/keto reductase [Propionibacteriaceae bacterium]